MKPKRHWTSAWIGLTAVVALVLMACTSGGGGGGSLFGRLSDTEVTESEFEALVNDATFQMAQKVSSAGYEIYYLSDDLVARRHALVWTIRIMREATRASFHADAVAQLTDLWVLALQQREFFENGDDDVFGPQQDIAIEACDDAIEIITELALNKARLAASQESIEAWARDHPLQTMLMARVSAAPLLARVLKRPSGRSIFEASDTVAEGMSNVADRLETMQFNLPTLLMAQARLVADDVQAGIMDDLDLAGLTEQLDRAVILAESLPGEINGQRVATLEQLEAEREAIMDEIDRQRAETLAWMDELRVASFADVADLQDQVVADFDTLAAIVTESIDIQRIDTLDRFDATIDRSLALSEARLDRLEATIGPGIETQVNQAISAVSLKANDVIDHLFLRLVQLMGVVFVGALILLLVARGWRRS